MVAGNNTFAVIPLDDELIGGEDELLHGWVGLFGSGAAEQLSLPRLLGGERALAVHIRVRLGRQHQGECGAESKADAERARGIQVGSIVQPARGLLTVV